jgi:hypothetical protein
VSLQQLQSIMPNLSTSRAQQMLPHLNAAMQEAGINTPRRQAAFLAQLAGSTARSRVTRTTPEPCRSLAGSAVPRPPAAAGPGQALQGGSTSACLGAGGASSGSGRPSWSAGLLRL